MKTSRIIAFVLTFILLPCCLQGCTTPVLKEIPACEKQILRTSENGLYLDESGNVWTWGINNYGGLGVDAEINRATEAVKVISNVVRIAAGSCQNLALDNQGKVWQWVTIIEAHSVTKQKLLILSRCSCLKMRLTSTHLPTAALQ